MALSYSAHLSIDMHCSNGAKKKKILAPLLEHAFWVFKELSVHLDPCFKFSVCVFFFFFQRVLKVTRTIHAHGFIVQETKCTVYALFIHCSCTVHGSHDTIHIFKNYFATVLSVFSKISCIQTDPKYTNMAF